MTFNTIGYQIANDYLQASFKLDAEAFHNLLAENIEMQHTTNDHEYKEAGRAKVMAIYKEKFFNVTSNFDVQEVTIRSNALQPEFTCKVCETKKEGQIEYRAEFIDHTILHVVREDDKWKIAKIVSQVSKTILS